jgi:hypothetical protein
VARHSRLNFLDTALDDVSSRIKSQPEANVGIGGCVSTIWTYSGSSWAAMDRARTPAFGGQQDATSRVGLPYEKKTGFLRMHRFCDTG